MNRLCLTLPLLLSLDACTQGGTSHPHDAGGTDLGPAFDAGPRRDAGPLPDGGLPPDDAALGTGALRGEICGNGFDDDGDGLVDSADPDCNCAVGTTRACWLGPPDVRGVGACHDGLQTCDATGAHASWGFCDAETLPRREILANGADDNCDGRTDEPDGVCLPTTQHESGTQCLNGVDDDCNTLTDCADPACATSPSCPPACPSTETVCWGGADEDCDGHVDCADSDCTTDPACVTGPCPTGQTPTYRQRALGTSWGASSISAGDGQPVMRQTCESGPCARGQVQVILADGTSLCVPPPPACTGGTSANYVASGTWRCDPPCAYVIHFGSLYGGLYACAGPPPACGAGNVATFDAGSLAWVCRAMCDGGAYDPIFMGTGVVCVPC